MFWAVPIVLLLGFVGALIVADVRRDHVPAILGLVCAVGAVVAAFAYVTRDTGTRALWWVVVALACGVIVGIVVAVWWAKWWWLAGSLACAVAGGLVLFLLLSGSEETEPLDPHPGAPSRIVALGDSYISGEGAPRYFPHTDEKGNRCTATAHPYLVANKLGASLTFAACSAARTFHVTMTAQFKQDPLLAGAPQIALLRQGPARAWCC